MTGRWSQLNRCVVCVCVCVCVCACVLLTVIYFLQFRRVALEIIENICRAGGRNSTGVWLVCVCMCVCVCVCE